MSFLSNTMTSILSAIDSYAATEALYFNQLINSNDVENAKRMRDERREAVVTKLSELQLSPNQPTAEVNIVASLARAVAQLEAMIELLEGVCDSHDINIKRFDYVDSNRLANAERAIFELKIQLHALQLRNTRV